MAPRRKAWMPFYVGDYLADTADLTTEEHGAYFLLLIHYWTTGPLPTNHARLANICGLSKHKFSKNSTTILRFFNEKDGKYFHKRMDKEIAKSVEISEIKAESGRKGGLAKATADAKAHAKAYEKQKPCTTTTTEEHSVDKSTGDKPPDPKAELFKLWVSVCVQAGIKEQHARSVLGKQLRDCPEKAVFAAVGVTCSESRSDPIAFLIGQLKANPKTGKKPDSEIVRVIPAEKLLSFAHERGISGDGPVGISTDEYRIWLSRKLTERERAIA